VEVHIILTNTPSLCHDLISGQTDWLHCVLTKLELLKVNVSFMEIITNIWTEHPGILSTVKNLINSDIAIQTQTIWVQIAIVLLLIFSSSCKDSMGGW